MLCAEENIDCINAASPHVCDLFLNICDQSCRMMLKNGRKLQRLLLIPLIILVLYRV